MPTILNNKTNLKCFVIRTIICRLSRFSFFFVKVSYFFRRNLIFLKMNRLVLNVTMTLYVCCFSHNTTFMNEIDFLQYLIIVHIVSQLNTYSYCQTSLFVVHSHLLCRFFGPMHAILLTFLQFIFLLWFLFPVRFLCWKYF